MIVCICKSVNERAIRRAVAEGHDTFDAVQFELGVGTCCGKCVATACEVLCDARREAVEAPMRAPAPATHAPLRFVPGRSQRPMLRAALA